MLSTLTFAKVMALSLRSRNNPREKPSAGAASMLGGLAWGGEGGGPGERGLGTDGALLGLGALGGARRLVLGASAGGAAGTDGSLACERGEAAALESSRVQAVHIHCVGCTLLVRRRAIWSVGMLRPHIEQGGGGAGAFAGGAWPRQAGGARRMDRGRLGSLLSGALDGGWEPAWCCLASCVALGCVPSCRAIGAGGVVTRCGLIVALVV